MKTMNWAVVSNGRTISLKKIPQVSMEILCDAIESQCAHDARPVAFFGVERFREIELFVVLADDENSRLLAASSLLKKGSAYPSITVKVPAFHLFERELFEEHGIVPQGHPWLKNVRYPHEHSDKKNISMTDYPFFKMEGEELHEVAVGPVHAGVIEPGHFRFMCLGEKVQHLEIQLGYQHRGVEERIKRRYDEQGVQGLAQIVESVAGDSVIAYTTAYAHAIESLAAIDVTRRAKSIRAIALELERTAVHIGDLGMIANDVAFLMGSSVFGATRTLIINTSLALTGSRFGRGLIRAGGAVYDIDDTLKTAMIKTLEKVERDVVRMSETMFSSATVLSRLEKAGVVTREDARAIGMVGMAARASGLPRDIRADHPSGLFRFAPIYKIVFEGGDCFSRAYIRYVEIQKSLKFILEELENLPLQKTLMQPIKHIAPDSLVVSMEEGWRGEIVHTVITGTKGQLVRYKIKDPSFNNWYGLALAVRGNGVSDFPLCNKSFNLSYCGHDL